MVKGGFPQSSESCPQKQSPTPPTHKNTLLLLNVSFRYTFGYESNKGKIDTVEGCSWCVCFLEMAGRLQELDLESKLSRAMLFGKKKDLRKTGPVSHLNGGVKVGGGEMTQGDSIFKTEINPI